MNKFKTLFVNNRKDWRKWLEKNFDKEKEIWLIYPKKSSGEKRILYNDAVEEALCFGWIDSIVKSFNEESSIQHFSRRNPKSSYSQANKERMKWLLKHNMIHPSISETATRILEEKFEFQPDIIEAIKNNKIAWKNYNKFSDTYKRIRTAYIEAARKRPDEFQKRLKNFIMKTAANKQIEFGGIEKYY